MKLKRIFKGFVISCLLIIPSAVMAVTLPSTSYTPSYLSSDDGYSSGTFGVGVTLPQTSYVRLGIDGSWGDECSSASPQSLEGCQNCCVSKFDECCPSGDCDDDTYEECKSLYSECANACGRSVPLGSGLVMAVMAMLYGAERIVSIRRSSK